jgi:hypothetical protein
MLSTTSELVHPKRSATGIATKTGEDSATLQNTTVPAKFRLASVAIMVTITARTIAGEADSEARLEMRLVPAGRTTDQDTTCHQKKS